MVGTLARQSEQAPVILQPRLRNHQALASVTREALDTVRIVTTRRPNAGATVLFALMRIATGTSTVDNLSQGGLACVVDVTTGSLDDAYALVDDFTLRPHATHPDTDTSFKALAIPFWTDALDLAIRAHNTLGRIPCVGWDIAVTDSGPVLLEGNWLPGMTIVQRITRVPILSTEYSAAFAECLDLPECELDDDWLAGTASWNPL